MEFGGGGVWYAERVGDKLFPRAFGWMDSSVRLRPGSPVWALRSGSDGVWVGVR